MARWHLESPLKHHSGSDRLHLDVLSPLLAKTKRINAETHFVYSCICIWVWAWDLHVFYIYLKDRGRERATEVGREKETDIVVLFMLRGIQKFVLKDFCLQTSEQVKSAEELHCFLHWATVREDRRQTEKREESTAVGSKYEFKPGQDTDMQAYGRARICICVLARICCAYFILFHLLIFFLLLPSLFSRFLLQMMSSRLYALTSDALSPFEPSTQSILELISFRHDPTWYQNFKNY